MSAAAAMPSTCPCQARPGRLGGSSSISWLGCGLMCCWMQAATKHCRAKGGDVSGWGYGDAPRCPPMPRGYGDFSAPSGGTKMIANVMQLNGAILPSNLPPLWGKESGWDSKGIKKDSTALQHLPALEVFMVGSAFPLGTWILWGIRCRWSDSSLTNQSQTKPSCFSHLPKTTLHLYRPQLLPPGCSPPPARHSPSTQQMAYRALQHNHKHNRFKQWAS